MNNIRLYSHWFFIVSQLVLVILSSSTTGVDGLSSSAFFNIPAPRRISVTQVDIRSTPAPLRLRDIFAIADLRYNEWMLGDGRTPPPPREAFRAATIEIMEERVGAISFLARFADDKYQTAVGAGELSPIELWGAVVSENENGSFLYVTDVVTVQTHRRAGVGTALMDAMEEHAMQQGISELFLHVEKDNAQAIKFYEKRQFKVPSSAALDVDCLAKNAGTEGQMLLSKKLRRR